MGNTTSTELWAAMERLRFIERAAFWTGTVNRSDLTEVFGVSQAQASSDLQKYQQLNPGALTYNLNRKRYEGAPGMSPALHEPQLEEAMAQFLGEASAPLPKARGAGVGAGSAVGESNTGSRLAMVALPAREASLAVKRAVFQAVLLRLRLRVHYHSMSGKSDGWRWISPHAFAHDGYRWHVRAWCETHAAYRDFVLSRMKSAEMPSQPAGELPPDEAWETWEEIVVSPAESLTEEKKKALALDYGMRGDKLRLRVRKAMTRYLLKHLRLPVEGEGEDEPVVFFRQVE